MTPSKYQQDIYKAVMSTKNHLVISATAGAGKTTTAVHATRLIPYGKTAISIAFNKSIVLELKKRLPQGVDCATLHSVGFGCIRKHFPGEVGVNDKKQIDFIEPYYKDDHPRKKWVSIYKVDDICKRARVTMTPDNREALMKMCDDYVIDYESDQINVAVRVLKKLVEYNRDPDRYNAKIDFIDMIEIPALNDDIATPQYDYVFLDEAQDMSKLDQLLLKRLVKPITGRLIVVGDKRQSLYGFRGADPNAFQNFIDQPNTIQLPLSISYRCAKNIVKEAKTVYDDIEEFDKNPDGIVRKGKVEEIQEGDMVLSRTTRPLISVFFKLVGDGKKAYVAGKDMEKGLLSFLARFSDSDKTSDLHNQLDDILTKTIQDLKVRGIQNPEKHPKYGQVQEKLSIIKLLFSKFEYVNQVEKFIEEVFNDEEREGVRLSTIHRAKGLECDRVFVIETFEGKSLIPNQYAVTEDQLIQENNLKFVATTRAKHELVYLHL